LKSLDDGFHASRQTVLFGCHKVVFLAQTNSLGRVEYHVDVRSRFTQEFRAPDNYDLHFLSSFYSPVPIAIEVRSFIV
jgi:hypothetical protein